MIVMSCDEDIIPNAERIKAITDDSDLHPRPGSPARVNQPAWDQLQIVRAARTIALQMHKEPGMGRGEISVSPHRDR